MNGPYYGDQFFHQPKDMSRLRSHIQVRSFWNIRAGRPDAGSRIAPRNPVQQTKGSIGCRTEILRLKSTFLCRNCGKPDIDLCSAKNINPQSLCTNITDIIEKRSSDKNQIVEEIATFAIETETLRKQIVQMRKTRTMVIPNQDTHSIQVLPSEIHDYGTIDD